MTAHRASVFCGRLATGPRKRVLSIERALVWAFRDECANVDFDAEASPDSYRGCDVDSVWLVMARGRVGCQIDGGGHSVPHHDADLIASAVANLPVECGGRGMAVQIAGLARAGMRPDCMIGARQRCVPREWAKRKEGRFAKTEVVGSVDLVWRGRKSRRDIMACPVTYRPSAAQIASARRNYLDWWGALLHLSAELRGLGILSDIEVTMEMPPLHPWRSDEGA